MPGTFRQLMAIVPHFAHGGTCGGITPRGADCAVLIRLRRSGTVTYASRVPTRRRAWWMRGATARPAGGGGMPDDPLIVRNPISAGSRSQGTVWGASGWALTDIPSSGSSRRCPASHGSRSGRSATMARGRSAGRGSAGPKRPTSLREGCTTGDPRGRCSRSTSMYSRIMLGPRSGGRSRTCSETQPGGPVDRPSAAAGRAGRVCRGPAASEKGRSAPPRGGTSGTG